MSKLSTVRLAAIAATARCINILAADEAFDKGVSPDQRIEMIETGIRNLAVLAGFLPPPPSGET